MKNIYIFATLFWFLVLIVLTPMLQDYSTAQSTAEAVGMAIGSIIAPALISCIALIWKKYRGKEIFRVMWAWYFLFGLVGLYQATDKEPDNLIMLFLAYIILYPIQSYGFAYFYKRS